MLRHLASHPSGAFASLMRPIFLLKNCRTHHRFLTHLHPPLKKAPQGRSF